MITSLIHTPTNDWWRPPMIDVAAYESTTSRGRVVHYRFEFDMSSVLHRMEQGEPTAIVLSNDSETQTYSFDCEVTTAAGNVVAVESYTLPVDNTITDILRDDDQWTVDANSTSIAVTYS